MCCKDKFMIHHFRITVVKYNYYIDTTKTDFVAMIYGAFGLLDV